MSSLGGASACSISGSSSLKITQSAPKLILVPLVPSQKQKTAFRGSSLFDIKNGGAKRMESKKQGVRSIEIKAGTAGIIAGAESSGNGGRPRVRASDQIFYSTSFFVEPANKLEFTKALIQGKPRSVCFTGSRSCNSTKVFAQTTPRPEPQTIRSPQKPDGERIFFDGGAHYGDLIANLALGFTLLWLPLTIAAVFRAFFLRYRFTNLRVTVISGLTGTDRSDFSYDVIKDVKVVPRFIGEWGDVIITLTDGTMVDLRSVPKFREIADYCLYMADQTKKSRGKEIGSPKGF